MGGDRAAPGPTGWAGLQAIATVHRLNARCFTTLAEVVQSGSASIERSPIYRNAELWRQMDQMASERAGRCPVLLINLNFDRLDWWKRVSEKRVAVPGPAASSELIDEAQATPLLREILMEVWHLGRSMPRAANLLFGMAPGVSEQISELTVRQVDQIAVDYARNLRPRWEENAVFWKNLLQAAIGTDDEALFAVHLHCLQLLGNDSQLR